jgi:PIN domain nuclease of toxin-antitoxin system
MNEAFVLDASAILALLARERGWEVVRDALPTAGISTVNLAEAAGKLIERGANVHEVAELLDLGVERLSFDTEMAFAAAQMKQVASVRGLSLGDRCCLATAWCLGRPVLTADAAWTRVAVSGLAVRLVR